MANTITPITRYLPLVDELYSAEAKSGLLRTPAILFDQTHTVRFKKISTSGLMDYDKETGYSEGSITVAWEDFTLPEDRGVSLNIDFIDNEETFRETYLQAEAKFARTQVIPEIDANTFATIAGTSGIGTATATDVVPGTTDVDTFVEAGIAAFEEAGVPEANRILYISPVAYQAFKANITRQAGWETNITALGNKVETYNNIPVIVVPQSRFYDSITMNSAGNGGYSIPAGAHKINFLLVDKNAIVSPLVRANVKVIMPDVNQARDGYDIKYRFYYGTKVLDNKVNGIYLSAGAAATT